MAKIFVKGVRDPLSIDDVRGATMLEMWEKGTLDPIVRIGNLATIRREDIKAIMLSEETRTKKENSVPCGVKDCEGGCHWTITRDDGRSIWQQPYNTKQEAQAELSFSNLSGYHLEHHFK